MPSRCCIPNCKGNYDSSLEKVSVFKFPENKELLEKWLLAIPRKEFVPTKSSRVCESHFRPSDVERETFIYHSQTGEKLSAKLRHPRLKSDAVPGFFPGCPSYLSTTQNRRENPDEKKDRLENAQLNKVIEQSLLTKEKEDKKNLFASYDEFLTCLKVFDLPFNWTLIEKFDCIIFALIEYGDGPLIKASVVVNSKLQMTAFHKTTRLLKCGNTKLPKLACSMLEISEIIKLMESDQLNSCDYDICSYFDDIFGKIKNASESMKHGMNFLKEQVSLLSLKKEQRRYEPQQLIFYSLLYSISPHAYKFIRNSDNLILPHPTTIRKITSKLPCNPSNEQEDSNFLNYVAEKWRHLKKKENTVVLMLDEIHLKPYFDYKGGDIVGSAFDSELPATSAHTFMIASLQSNYKDVAHIVPVKCITAETLHFIIKKVIVGLENIGFEIVAVITDNNAINGKAMSLFSNPSKIQISYTHPANPQRPLFYVIDAVHIFKCIRNNWLNQKNDGLCMYYPNFEGVQECRSINKLETASFATLRKLHELEHANLVKYGYGLTLKALNPTNLERQNVQLVIQVFNDFIAKALLELGEKHALNFHKGTAEYLKIILRWWWVLNVKSPDKGKNLKNVFMYPLTNIHNDERKLFLMQFIDWLDVWENSNCATGALTKETHRAINHTSRAILELSTYCCEQLKMDYLLTGKFQTDALEERFGKYRTLAGSQYSVSIRQIFESESKLRLQNFLPLTLKSSKFGEIGIARFDIDMVEETEPLVSEDLDLCLDEIDINVGDSLPVLVYMAGYCVYSICNKLKCDSCENQLTMDRELAVDDCYKFISHLNRGSLKFPNADVVRIVSLCYAVAEKLLSPSHEKKFLRVKNQRIVMSRLAMSMLTNLEIFNDVDVCASGHMPQLIVKKIIWITTNIFLKNYCSKKNDVVKKISQKRKLKTLEKE